ncbi:MAG: M13 family metallopeptidase [Nitrososphaerota archaeon]|nr:M13 family metallopeptidase [Nitrososphaerota archaeon]
MARKAPSTTTPRKAPGFSESYMDRRADPRNDFYRYAAGGWMRTHPLPRDKARYGAFTELNEWNLISLRKVAEKSAKDAVIARGGTAALVGKFYRSALDRRSREKAAFGPVDDLWRAAGAVRDGDDVARVLRKLHMEGIGAGFQDFSKVDDRDSGVYAYFLWQGGLSLPDKDYYLSGSFKKTREQFLSHVRAMFEMKGLSPREGKAAAASVLRVETSLAKASRSRTDLRDPVKNYNRVEAAELGSRYPRVSPLGYLDDAGVSAKYAVVGQPEFFASLEASLGEKDADDWRSYLEWAVITDSAPYLHAEAEDENFDFFQRKLMGQKEPEAEWKRAIKVVDRMVGEALGELYVADYFPEEARKRAADLVQNLSEVFEGRLRALPWMTDSTKAEALQKFKRFRVKIGHPVKFRDYSKVRVEREDYAGNVRRAAAFEVARQAARVGAPVDRDEWFMTPPTVNAYYSPETNEIVFPAGILQPPFFDHRADDAVNYGGIGAVIGHEITHGYDDQGRQYDAIGNLRDWWTKEDEAAFKEKADGVVKAYGSQEVLPGLKLNGKLTLGENIADLGGLSIAYEALTRRRKKTGGAKIGGLTSDERFFVSWGQVWRQTISDQEARRLATIDPHSPGKIRAVIPAVNHPAFDRVFPPAGGRGRKGPKIGVW